MGLGCWALLGPITSALFAGMLNGASIFGFDFSTDLLELGELVLLLELLHLIASLVESGEQVLALGGLVALLPSLLASL